ncbi:MAG: hypothetical protein JNL93_00965 [Pelomonas sp.]|nr:hypothetical protein [Roseateles sp.]
MKLVRGFKTYAERLVQDVRAEMGMGQLDPMDMDALARHLHIPYWSLSQFLEAAKQPKDSIDVAEIYKKVSAFTFFEGRRRRIVYNDEHGPVLTQQNLHRSGR